MPTLLCSSHSATCNFSGGDAQIIFLVAGQGRGVVKGSFSDCPGWAGGCDPPSPESTLCSSHLVPFGSALRGPTQLLSRVSPCIGCSGSCSRHALFPSQRPEFFGSECLLSAFSCRVIRMFLPSWDLYRFMSRFCSSRNAGVGPAGNLDRPSDPPSHLTVPATAATTATATRNDMLTKAH